MEPVDQVIEDAIAICAVPAPTFAEERRAAFVADLLGGPETTRDEVGNVVCRLGPPEGDAVVFAAHLDTVFPTEQPIDIVREPDRIHAPGIGDNSLGVASLVHLARVLRATPPRRSTLLTATVGEEGLGDLRGAKHLVTHIDCAAFVAVEGGMRDRLTTAAVGSTRLRVSARGPGGHSWGDRGTPSAVNAVVEALSRFLAVPAPPGLARNIGRINGGTSINTIAAEATAEIDLRALDDGVLAAAAAEAQAMLAEPSPGLEMEVEIIGRRPGGRLPDEHPLLLSARRARAHVGLPAAHEDASSTDANAALGRGIPALTVGITTGGHAHRIEEYIDLPPIADGIAALEHFARELTASG